MWDICEKVQAFWLKKKGFKVESDGGSSRNAWDWAKIYQQYEAVESPWKPFYFEQKHHWGLCGILHKPWCYSTFVNVVWVVELLQ